MSQRVGVLAVQGGFDAHRARLNELGASTLLVKKAAELDALDGIVLPGGESSTMLKLLGEDFFLQLGKNIQDGLPTLATCAGAILLAKHVTNPQQRSLAVLDIDIHRNAYGRQIDSFIDPLLPWTKEGRSLTANITCSHFLQEAEGIEGVFIRAPKIARIGTDVKVLIESKTGDPLLVSQGKILAATFHPELSPAANTIHQLFLDWLN